MFHSHKSAMILILCVCLYELKSCDSLFTESIYFVICSIERFLCNLRDTNSKRNTKTEFEWNYYRVHSNSRDNYSIIMFTLFDVTYDDVVMPIKILPFRKIFNLFTLHVPNYCRIYIYWYSYQKFRIFFSFFLVSYFLL